LPLRFVRRLAPLCGGGDFRSLPVLGTPRGSYRGRTDDAARRALETIQRVAIHGVEGNVPTGNGSDVAVAQADSFCRPSSGCFSVRQWRSIGQDAAAPMLAVRPREITDAGSIGHGESWKHVNGMSGSVL